MLFTSRLVVNLVDPADLLVGRVGMRFRPGLLNVRLDRNAVDPAAGPAIATMGREVMRRLATMRRQAIPLMVRYHLEHDLPGGQLITAEVGPYQIDVCVLSGLMSYDVSQEIAGHATYILRRGL